MEFVGELVEHKTFGTGKITEFNDIYIVVKFEDDTLKDFVYPDAFDLYLKLINQTLYKQVKEKLDIHKKKEAEKELREIERKEEAHKLKLLKAEIENSKKISIKKIDSNIVFKCNYCDGGSNNNGIGYKSVCSDEIINYNINIAKNKVCSELECNCNQYLIENITRSELEDRNNENKNFCYERKLLNNWFSYPDLSFIAKNGAKVKSLKNVNQGSLVLLSTVLPNEKEKDRIIFGAYLLQDDYLFAYNTEGYLKAHDKYRVELSLDESKKIRFWNYCYNTKNPKRIANSSTAYKYFDDVQAAQVLKAIMDIKKNTSEETIVNEIFENYCKEKNIDVNTIPLPI
jgi:hypothetical protein